MRSKAATVESQSHIAYRRMERVSRGLFIQPLLVIAAGAATCHDAKAFLGQALAVVPIPPIPLLAVQPVFRSLDFLLCATDASLIDFFLAWAHHLCGFRRP